MRHTKFGFDWPSGFREEKKMFEYYGHTHVYSPGAGADNSLGPKYFHKHEYSVHLLILSKFFATKLHFPIFSHSNAWAASVDLPVKRSRSSQGHDLY